MRKQNQNIQDKDYGEDINISEQEDQMSNQGPQGHDQEESKKHKSVDVTTNRQMIVRQQVYVEKSKKK